MGEQRYTGNHRHWHYLYARRRRFLGINAKQMAWGQVFSLLGSIVAGVLLESNKETLVLIAGALVILPGVFDLDGSLGAALSAKINHRLEDPNAKTWQVFFYCVGFALLIAATAGAVVAFVGGLIAYIFFDASFLNVFKLGESAIVLSALLGFPLIGALSIFFRRLRINPDDVVGPIESSIFDMLTIITMAWVVIWLM